MQLSSRQQTWPSQRSLQYLSMLHTGQNLGVGCFALQGVESFFSSARHLLSSSLYHTDEDRIISSHMKSKFFKRYFWSILKLSKEFLTQLFQTSQFYFGYLHYFNKETNLFHKNPKQPGSKLLALPIPFLFFCFLEYNLHSFVVVFNKSHTRLLSSLSLLSSSFLSPGLDSWFQTLKRPHSIILPLACFTGRSVFFGLLTFPLFCQT